MRDYSPVERIKDNYLLRITDFKDKEKVSFRDLNIQEIRRKLKETVKKEKIEGKKLYSIPYDKLWFNVSEEYAGVVIENNKWIYTCYISFDTKHQKQFIF